MTLRVVFMGSPEFSVPTLRALHHAFQVTGVVTQPDKRKGRGRKASPTPVKSAARELGIPVVDPDDVTSEESINLLAQWSPDIIVVAAYGKILPSPILTLAPMGCVNLHASLLPRHRGASPISAAILAGDQTTGVCTILMDEGMDTGDILLAEEIPIHDDDTAGSLHDGMLEPGARLVVKTLRLMVEQSVTPKSQSHGEATYTRPLTKADGRIDWSQEADYLSRLVRAMNPWPGAFTHLSGDSIKIWSAFAAEGAGEPGTIKEIGSDGIRVGTGKGLLVVRELQAPGKKRLTASEFARGKRLGPGDRFQEER